MNTLLSSAVLLLRQRLWLRRIFLILGALLLILLSAFSGMVAINHSDEPIERAAQAWLDYPAPSVPTEQNGYLAMLAINSQAPQPIVAADEFVRSEHAIQADAHANFETALPRYLEMHRRLLEPKQIMNPFRTNCLDGCYTYLIEHAALLDTFSRTHAWLNERYDALLSMTSYAENIPTDPESLSPQFSVIDAAATAHLGKAALALQHGEAPRAYKEWARHRRFWQTAAAGSISLNSVMKAIAQLELGQSLLMQMLTAHPETLAAAREYAQPVLLKRPVFSSVLLRSLVHEFQIHSYLVDQYAGRFSLWNIATFGLMDDYPERPAERLSLLFFQRNATLNLLHRVHRNDMALHRLKGNALPVDREIMAICDRKSTASMTAATWRWERISNPTGKALVCDAEINYRTQHERIKKVEAMDKQLEKKFSIQ